MLKMRACLLIGLRSKRAKSGYILLPVAVYVSKGTFSNDDGDGYDNVA